jgi:hypothetical protein
MKMTPLILNQSKRHQDDQRPADAAKNFPQINQNYHNPTLVGGCGTPAKFRHPAFFEISDKYFADEAPRSFAVETAVFAALILTALLPIVNSAQAIAALVQSATLF